MFQSRDALKWVSAAESVRNWLLSDRDWHFFDDGSTHHGSDHAEEGEEESEGDDDDIDPQDRLLHAERGDRDDGDGTHVSGTWEIEFKYRDTNRNENMDLSQSFGVIA